MELRKTTSYIAIDPALCSGCRSCMAVCSLSHTGESNPELAGIQVIGFLREGNTIEASTCLQCPRPKCLDACPEGAIRVDKLTGAKVIASEMCTGCRLCIDACRNKNKSNSGYDGNGLCPIRYDSKRSICFKCDLCGGIPLCVKTCPMNALRVVTREG